VQGNATIRLFWRSTSQKMEICPSSRLYHATTSAYLSQPQLFVQPSVICATQSSAAGPGLTIGTAGVMSYFTIQSRDEYANNRVLGDSPYLSVRIVPIAEARRPYHVNMNELMKAGSTVNSGITRIAGKGEYPGGLTATYYGDSSSSFEPSATSKVSCMEKPWQSNSFCGGPKITGQVITGISGSASSAYTVRFKGNFLPTLSTSYRFYLSRDGSNPTSSAGLIVDNFVKIAIDLNNPSTSTMQYADISMEPGNFYDVEVVFKSVAAQTGDFELKYCVVAGCALGDSSSIPTSNLFPIAGRYNTFHTPTAKGDYSVSAAVAVPGGLDATFYDDLSLSTPVSNARSSTIDFTSLAFQDTDLGLPRNSNQIGFGNDLKLSDRNSFSVRWQGFFRTVTTSPVTFIVATDGSDERIRLWVDNVMLIDQWDSYQEITTTSFSATFSVAYSESTGVQLSDANSYFDLRLEYKQFSGPASIKLSYEINGAPATPVPASALFFKKDISGSPFPPFAVVAAPTCSATSTVRGSALTSSTAGIASSFTIQSNDMYNNERGSGGDVYVVRLSAGCTGGVCSCRVANTCPVVLGSVVDLGDSSYVATYNATRIGKYMVHTSLAGIGRLSLTRTTTISSTNNAGPVILPLSTYNAQTASQVHVFSGFVRPHRAGSYTFSVTGSSGTSGYFSFTPQLNTATDAASTTYVFNTANSLYDISFQWTAAGTLP